ncbi:DUF4116 domain-containing protein [Polaromonas vacuolata]|uniref:DUF4116 domain-containing protein n=1 Tax=Polaromonas vacuolata TaxID=37448 RepID=UPI0014569D75|nr:DUF4116 domain-containing protein [Polaromonas vacuolata]
MDSKNSSASSASSASSKPTFNAIPKEFFPLMASFCGDQFQSLNRVWISSRDNKSIDNRIPKSMLMTMVSLNAMVLSTLPMGMRDLNICKAALKQNGLAWPHIPRKFREEAHTSLGADLAMIAVKSNGLALGKIKPQFHTPALRDAAVANNIMAIAYVPENKRTEKMYQLALAQVMGNSQLIAFLQPHMRTAEMYELAVKEGNCPLKYIPPEILSKTMFMNRGFKSEVQL